MKKNKIFFLMCFFGLSACVTNEYWKLKVDLPRNTEIDLDEYTDVVVTPFLVKEKTEGFDLNKELVDYLVSELKRKADKQVHRTDQAVDKEEVFESAEYWKNLDSDPQGKLYLSGTAQYTEDIRKALIRKEKKRYDDPFPSPATLEERKFYTLDLNLYLIDAQTGMPVFKKDFKETKSYDNPNQTGYYAFFDLILQVKNKLFRSIIGGDRLEERYLIMKKKE